MRNKLNRMLMLMFFSSAALAQKNKTYHVKSPDGKIDVSVEAGQKINWSVKHENTQVLIPSAISLTLNNGDILGHNARISSTKSSSVNSSFLSPFYKKNAVTDNYNELILNLKGDYGLIFRAYNDGVAYRFFTNRKGGLIIKDEEADFNFKEDDKVFIPFVHDYRNNDKYNTSFESLYHRVKLSGISKDSMAFLPVLVDLGDKKKAVILEADLESYPGMYLVKNPDNPQSLRGHFAPYPLEEKPGGYHNLNTVVTKRADYIAKTSGGRNFPWRVLVISDDDKELLNNDMVQKLASPDRLTDVSWIKPGKVAWDWWNDWNISHVDFRAGINTETYKYYIDFAAANRIEYIIMDEGWSSSTDVMKISDKIDLKEIINYGKQKNVGVILWASYTGISKQMDEAFSRYAEMGVKGFKIDFLDRDDQKMVESVYEMAKKAAQHKLLVDFHGMYKPTGFQRTYPNIINAEGVKGMENVKWAHEDVPSYDVSIPFIRMLAGPMDYTPGAMRNSTEANFHPVNSMPMSQGTRCHQLAMYVVFEAPLQMLADNPTAYMKEQESTNFIAKIPTTFDKTVALAGEAGEYAALARHKGDSWYVGAMTNWTPREITIDLSFLEPGNYQAEIFSDGINADRDATDYKREVLLITPENKDKFTIRMTRGGGWAARISRIRVADKLNKQ